MATSERQNESALVCAARQGDKDALQLLLTRNWAWLRGLVYGIVGDADETDDVLQDICVRVITKIESVRQPERFRPWLAVLARRQALRHRHQDSRPVCYPTPMTEDTQYAIRDTHDELERTEQCEQILKAVRSLPEKYREIFMLSYGSGLTYREIGEILDIPLTTVQIRLVRARRMIYDRVAGKEDRIQEKRT